MIQKTEWNKNKVIVTYELSESDLQILSHLKEHGYKEFRNGHSSDIVDNLYDYGFVKSDHDSWHYTVHLTVLGKAVVENIGI